MGLVDQNHLLSICQNVRHILWAQEDCQMSASHFQDLFCQNIGGKCNFDDLERDLKEIIEVVNQVL